jgi:hypothetical protein
MSKKYLGKLEYIYGKVESDYDVEELGMAIKPNIDDYLEWELIGKEKEGFMWHHAYLPYMYSNYNSDGAQGPTVSDPLTIYINMQIGSDIDGIGFKTNLTELIDDMFDGECLGDYIGKKSVNIFTDMRNALSKEIEKIDKWIAEAIDDAEIGENNG